MKKYNEIEVKARTKDGLELVIGNFSGGASCWTSNIARFERQLYIIDLSTIPSAEEITISFLERKK